MKVIFGQTYPLLSHARAALVTSGTATLETALFRVPQVVCYYVALPKLTGLLKRWLLKVKFVSLVNLIANREVVTELVADKMTVNRIESELRRLLYDQEYVDRQQNEYDEVALRLGEPGASAHAAHLMVEFLAGHSS